MGTNTSSQDGRASVLNPNSISATPNLYPSTSPRLFTHLGFLSMTYYCETCETHSFRINSDRSVKKFIYKRPVNSWVQYANRPTVRNGVIGNAVSVSVREQRSLRSQRAIQHLPEERPYPYTSSSWRHVRQQKRKKVRQEQEDKVI